MLGRPTGRSVAMIYARAGLALFTTSPQAEQTRDRPNAPPQWTAEKRNIGPGVAGAKPHVLFSLGSVASLRTGEASSDTTNCSAYSSFESVFSKIDSRSEP
jgi:hypothetical protein